MEVWNGSAEEKILGLMKIWSGAKEIFPHREKLKELNWDDIVKPYIARVIAANTLNDYYFILMEFASLLKDGHTNVIPPWGYFVPNSDNPPIELEVINNKFYIARIGNTEEIKNQNIQCGMEVTHIEGETASEFFSDKICKYYERGTEQANNVFNMFYILNGQSNSKVNLTLDGSMNVRITRNSVNSDGTRFIFRVVNIEPSFEAEVIDDILYMRIASFEDEKLADVILNYLDNMDTPAGLVIDLRFNTGGKSRVSEAIISALISEETTTSYWKYPLFIPAERNWGRSDKWEITCNTIKPRDGKTYSGPIIVLTSGLTGSSSEDFVVSLQNANRVVTIGQKTAGSSGHPINIPLPFGGTFRVATFTALTKDKKEYVGVGIDPNIEVIPTPSDLANGIDPVVNRAVEEIKKL